VRHDGTTPRQSTKVSIFPLPGYVQGSGIDVQNESALHRDLTRTDSSCRLSGLMLSREGSSCRVGKTLAGGAQESFMRPRPFSGGSRVAAILLCQDRKMAVQLSRFSRQLDNISGKSQQRIHSKTGPSSRQRLFAARWLQIPEQSAHSFANKDWGFPVERTLSQRRSPKAEPRVQRPFIKCKACKAKVLV
jgi:hypothetical protein